MSRTGRRVARYGLLGMLVLWAGMLAASVAMAHANFQGASPDPGAHLPEGPREIVIRFNEPVTPVTFQLLDASLQPVPGAGAPRVDGNDIRMTLSDTLPDGWYLVSYRVISEDAHPVAASFEFAVGAAAGNPGFGTGQAAVDTSSTVGWFLRPVLLVALILAAGSALFLAFLGNVASASVRAVTTTLGTAALWSTLALALAAFAAGGAEMIGGDASAMRSVQAWRTAAGSTLGTSTAFAMSGVLLAGLGFRRQGRTTPSRALLVAGTLGLALSRASTGHAAAASAGMMLAMALHVLLASFWAGALWPLWKSLRAGPLAAARVLMDAFSRLAMVAVALTVVVGVYMAWVHVGSLSALTGTTYGRWLVLKLVVVVVLLALAGANKWWLTPALVTKEGAAVARRMGLSVGIEIAAMAMLLLVSATLAHTPPPGGSRGVTSAVPDSLGGMVMEGDYHLTWRLSPGVATPGGHEFTLRFQRHDGTPVDPIAISASFASQDRGIEPLAVDMSRTDPGSYVATLRGLTAPGEWQLAFDILVTDFDKLVLEIPVTLR